MCSTTRKRSLSGSGRRSSDAAAPPQKGGGHRPQCAWAGCKVRPQAECPAPFSFQFVGGGDDDRDVRAHTKKQLLRWWARALPRCPIDNTRLYIYASGSSVDSEGLLLADIEGISRACTCVVVLRHDSVGNAVKMMGCVTRAQVVCAAHCASKRVIPVNEFTPVCQDSAGPVRWSRGAQASWMVLTDSGAYERPFVITPSFGAACMKDGAKCQKLEVERGCGWRIMLDVRVWSAAQRLRATTTNTHDALMDAVAHALQVTDSLSYFLDATAFKAANTASLLMKLACSTHGGARSARCEQIYRDAEGLIARYCMSRLCASEKSVVRSVRYAKIDSCICVFLDDDTPLKTRVRTALDTFYTHHYPPETPRPRYAIRVSFRAAHMYVDGCPLCMGCAGLVMEGGWVYVGYMEMGYVAEEHTRAEATAYFSLTSALTTNGVAPRLEAAVTAHSIATRALLEWSATSAEKCEDKRQTHAFKFSAPAVSGTEGRCAEAGKIIEYVTHHFPPCVSSIVLRQFPPFLQKLDGKTRKGHPEFKERQILMQFLAQLNERLVPLEQKKQLYYFAFSSMKHTVSESEARKWYTSGDASAADFLKFMNKHSGSVRRMLNGSSSGGSEGVSTFKGCRRVIGDGLCPFARMSSEADYATLFSGHIDGSSHAGRSDIMESAGQFIATKNSECGDIENTVKLCSSTCSAYLWSRSHHAPQAQKFRRVNIYSPIQYCTTSTRAAPMSKPCPVSKSAGSAVESTPPSRPKGVPDIRILYTK